MRYKTHKMRRKKDVKHVIEAILYKEALEHNYETKMNNSCF